MQLIGNGIGIPFQRKVGGGFVGLLDEYSGAAFAASVRLLRADYAGGLLRARANDGSTDQGEADVLPYDDGGSERFVSLDSRLINLDATAVTRGLTTSDTLGDLLDVGAGNYDGFIPTWYGQQAGSSINAVQTTASDQPKIATAGALEVENGKPALQFGSFAHLRTSSFAPLSVHSFFDVIFSSNDTQFIRDGISTSNRSALYVITTTRYTRGIGQSYAYTNDLQSLYSTIVSGSNTDLAQNGSSLESKDAGSETLTGINIGGFFDNSVLPFLGKYQEITLYPTNQSLNRIDIESNINNAFSIYP